MDVPTSSQLMIPLCEALPEAVRLDDDVPWSEFSARLIKRGATAQGGIWLMECRDCGQAWRIDRPGPWRVALAIKTPTTSPDDWSVEEDHAVRVRYLEKTYNGVDTVECVWRDCPNRALRNLAMCAEHLYATGSRARGG
jgi:hypothetical protein